MTKQQLSKGPYILRAISFLTGFALMAFELVAARILAPTIGSSMYVWTSVIGVIIAALSLGYWVGGKLADKRNQAFDVVLMCLGAVVLVMLTTLAYPSYLPFIASIIEDTRVQGVVASLLLFAPTSFVLGAIGPYLAKLAIISLRTSGQSVAGLSALNSLGGILGTFVTGFVLFSYIGSRETLLVVVTILIAASWLLLPKRRVIERVTVSLSALLLVAIPMQLPAMVVAEVDSAAAHYRIADSEYEGQPTRLLMTGPNAAQSGVMMHAPDELVFWYTSYSAELIVNQNPKRVLILGGGALTLPGYLAKTLPNTTIDVVEIDPALHDIAKEYFLYDDQPNVSLYFQDARTFVNEDHEPYDVVFVDVYGDAAIPFSFLTKEYGDRIDRLTTDDGVVISNVIAGSQGACRQTIEVIDAMYRPHFPVAYWQTQFGQEYGRGNYILLHSRDASVDRGMKTLASTTTKVFTDNFAPAERMNFLCQQMSNSRF